MAQRHLQPGTTRGHRGQWRFADAGCESVLRGSRGSHGLCVLGAWLGRRGTWPGDVQFRKARPVGVNVANIVLGLGSSHGPQLGLTPDLWHRRAEADRTNSELWYRGRTYAFPDLMEERGPQTFASELSAEKATARFDACQRAISHLAETLKQAAPDVVVILGDDQHEAFDDDNMPAINVYWGDTI